MGDIALLGAGFSKNWGAPLTYAVMGSILGVIMDDPKLMPLVSDCTNFEDALGRIQSRYASNPTDANKRLLESMQRAVLSVFGRMTRTFLGRGGMEFSQNGAESVQGFLSRFDAIFTLNQDLLFELLYNIETGRPRQWAGHYFPAMRPDRDFRNTLIWEKPEALWRPVEPYAIGDSRTQPIFKLHGSVNWRDADGGELLILGSDKKNRIGRTQILSWYMEQFVKRLNEPRTKLMAIGYGFRDTHIDDEIFYASQRSGLRLFIVNPQGRKVFETGPPNQITIPHTCLKVPLIGESMAPLRRIGNLNATFHQRGLYRGASGWSIA